MQSKPALDIVFRRTVNYRGHVIGYGARPEKITNDYGWRWIPWAACNSVAFSVNITPATIERLTRVQAIKLARSYRDQLKDIIKEIAEALKDKKTSSKKAKAKS